MAAISNPKNTYPATEFSGGTRLVSFNNLTMTSNQDTITLSAASNGISAIQNVVACLNEQPTATFTAVCASFSGLTVTLTAVEQDGTAATSFGGVNLLVIGT